MNNINQQVESQSKKARKAMNKAKEIILEELREQRHPERVEDVIFWALEYYSNKKEDIWGKIIAKYIVDKIKESEINSQRMITKSEKRILTWDDYERQNNSGSFTLWKSEVSLEFKKSELIGKSDYLKRILVIHRIEKLKPYFGGAITFEEWGDKILEKYVIRKVSNEIERGLTYDTYHYLAFHTLEQRDLFFEHNYELVKEYLMLD